MLDFIHTAKISMLIKGGIVQKTYNKLLYVLLLLTSATILYNKLKKLQILLFALKILLIDMLQYQYEILKTQTFE